MLFFGQWSLGNILHAPRASLQMEVDAENANRATIVVLNDRAP